MHIIPLIIATISIPTSNLRTLNVFKQYDLLVSYTYILKCIETPSLNNSTWR